MARAGFATGQNPFGAVIEAERTLRRTELDYQLARAEYGYLGAAALLCALLAAVYRRSSASPAAV